MTSTIYDVYGTLPCLKAMDSLANKPTQTITDTQTFEPGTSFQTTILHSLICASQFQFLSNGVRQNTKAIGTTSANPQGAAEGLSPTSKPSTPDKSFASTIDPPHKQCNQSVLQTHLKRRADGYQLEAMDLAE
ncbi:hypothetical protein GOBAR_AA27845 [Gossypium barbadense]|uniref:Uncharacterized protein n=1 Tax=Gossypium barbadense TaxID=3634 RepID=A0A2P5WP29_GOSBA|nr:hypothetical protein GOBAR_AA27845 [Gossypium barbadense]